MNQHRTRRALLPQETETSLIGRSAECDAIERMLVMEHIRLISITGMGGVGKTRVALRVAEHAAPRFRDGCAIVPLASVSDYRLVPLALARALDLRLTGELPPEREIVRWLAVRELLLLFDTFEHLLPAARVLSELLEACPDVSVIVTSRVTPGMTGEAVFRLSPLATPPEPLQTLRADIARGYDAIALFEDRAHAASSAFTLTDDNAAAVAQLCRRLDGLPLAIELAAARVRALPPQLILRRIETHRETPGSGTRDAHSRHRTMRDTMTWSYDLLLPSDQRLFRALSLFHGPFTVDDAIDVLARWTQQPPDPDFLAKQLEALASASFLISVPLDSGEQSYIVHGLLREYGRERLRELGEAEGALRAHAWWVTTRVGPSREGGAPPADALREEIRAAIAWSLEQSGQALAETLLTAICPFWIELGFYQELRAWLEQAVMQSPSAPMLLALAQIAARQGEVARSLAYGQQVFDQAFQADDRSMLANGALTVAIAEGRLGNHHRSQAMGELALSSLRELADPARIAEAEAQLAHLALLRGDLGTAQSLAETVLDYRRLTGEPSRAIDMLDLLSLIARLRGDNVRQSALAQQTLELTLLVDNPFMIASGLWTAAAIACERGFYRESARFYGAEGAVRQASGFALDPGHRDEHAASIAAVRTALGVQVFAAEWETGQALGMAALQEAATFLAALAGTERDAYQAEKRALQSLGLSDRQQDVLRLIIQGRSDREIAAMLSISARTVSKHVEAILTRVDARTRSGAAAIAARLTADAQPGTLSPSIEPGQLL